MTTLTGSCLCGKTAYKIEGETTAFYHCHCQRCRKATGTGHASIIRVKASGIEWLRGEELIKQYKVPEAQRFRNDFCSECGASLPRHFPQMGMVVLPAGTLDHEPDIQPEARIFCGSRSDWSCSDEITSFSEYPE
ncbi:MAG: GFA family protein [Pseudomonadales bacterium]|jgi:hypothetical protein